MLDTKLDNRNLAVSFLVAVPVPAASVAPVAPAAPAAASAPANQ
jgi:hypothetical protein